MREFERVVLLSAIDHHWMDHIDAMDDLRDGIGLRAYGQREPGAGVPAGRATTCSTTWCT